MNLTLDMIEGTDLIEDISGNISKVYTTPNNELVYDYTEITDGMFCDDLVQDILEDIKFVYRKYSKGYICIWERGN